MEFGDLMTHSQAGRKGTQHQGRISKIFNRLAPVCVCVWCRFFAYL